MAVNLAARSQSGGHVGDILATLHIGCVSTELYQTFYPDTVDRMTRWVDNA